MGIAKEQRGHRTVFCIPGRGRMFPHSGQKFGSPPKHDISVEGQSVSAKQDWRWRWRPFPRPTHLYSLTRHAISMLPEIECSPLLMSDKHEYRWTHVKMNWDVPTLAMGCITQINTIIYYVWEKGQLTYFSDGEKKALTKCLFETKVFSVASVNKAFAWLPAWVLNLFFFFVVWHDGFSGMTPSSVQKRAETHLVQLGDRMEFFINLLIY